MEESRSRAADHFAAGFASGATLANGLAEEAVPAKVTVTVAGAPVDNIQVKVKDGTITLQNTSGTLLFFR